MNVWIVHLGLPQETAAQVKSRNGLVLPLEAEQDYTVIPSKQALKNAMREKHPDMPPESLNRLTDRIWFILFSVKNEDIVAVPLQEEKIILFAQVVSPARMENGQFVVGVKWFDRSASMIRFRRFRDLFESRASGALLEVTNTQARVKIRDQLPLPGNRFAKLKWLIIVLVAMRLGLFAVQLWRKETAGF